VGKVSKSVATGVSQTIIEDSKDQDLTEGQQKENVSRIKSPPEFDAHYVKRLEEKKKKTQTKTNKQTKKKQQKTNKQTLSH